jgi:glucose uptake protein GlcU
MLTVCILFFLILGCFIWAALTKWHKTEAIFIGMVAVTFLMLFIDITGKEQTTENLKEQYPVLQQAIYEEELQKELSNLLETKQVNDKRYIEIIKELR